MAIQTLRLTLIATLVLGAGTVNAIDFSPVTAPIGEYVNGKPSIPGAGLMIVDFDGTVHLEQYWGEFDRNTVIPIASATKWLSGTVVMSLVDDGLLDLDQPIGEILPVFNGKPLKQDMTVRQAFSHSGGATNQSIWQAAKEITLAESAVGIANWTDWLTAPGTFFHYGGVSMQVAGRVAEVRGGDDWDTLFVSRLTQPLGITDTNYQGLGPTTNPRIAGGGQSSMESYSRFLRMLANGGVYDGQQVLSEAAIATMLSDQTAGVPLDYAPPSLEEYHGYGIGNWILREGDAGQPVEFASPGAFGTTPWIDFENRYFGLFMIDDQQTNVDGMMDDLRAFARSALSVPGDYNRDGQVTAEDYSVWRSSYGTDNPNADGNRDGIVDATDYAIWREALNAISLPANAAPEPSVPALLVSFAMYAALRSRRINSRRSRPPGGTRTALG